LEWFFTKEEERTVKKDGTVSYDILNRFRNL
jgi:hypothetical protein